MVSFSSRVSFRCICAHFLRRGRLVHSEQISKEKKIVYAADGSAGGWTEQTDGFAGISIKI